MEVPHVVFQDLNLPSLEVAVEAVLGFVASKEVLPHSAPMEGAVVTEPTAHTVSLLLNKEIFLLLLCLSCRFSRLRWLFTVTSPLMSLHGLTVGPHKAAQILPAAEALQGCLLGLLVVGQPEPDPGVAAPHMFPQTLHPNTLQGTEAAAVLGLWSGRTVIPPEVEEHGGLLLQALLEHWPRPYEEESDMDGGAVSDVVIAPC